MLYDETDIEREGAAAGDQEGLTQAYLPHELGCDPEGEDDQPHELEEATGPISPGQGSRRLARGCLRTGLPPGRSGTVASLGHGVPR
jgi:hypothetical protein